MPKVVRDNSLSIALALLFSLSVLGHAIAGWIVENDERQLNGDAALSLLAYLATPMFLSSLFENWESEFLQMSMYVVLTAFLFQRGSPESRDPDADEGDLDRDPELDRHSKDAPWPVRAGGLIAKLYSHSLGAALFILFVASFLLHWTNSARQAAQLAIKEGGSPPTLLEHLGSAQLWFECFQNWQSEFLSTGMLVVLAIFLRERGSPESKPVGSPHWKTGGE